MSEWSEMGGNEAGRSLRTPTPISLIGETASSKLITTTIRFIRSLPARYLCFQIRGPLRLQNMSSVWHSNQCCGKAVSDEQKNLYPLPRRAVLSERVNADAHCSARAAGWAESHFPRRIAGSSGGRLEAHAQ